MADFVGNDILGEVEQGVPAQPVGNELTGEVEQGFSHPPGTSFDIIQRQWDTSVGWVQYTDATFNPTPAPGDTEPNHTGNLVASTHHILGEVAS